MLLGDVSAACQPGDLSLVELAVCMVLNVFNCSAAMLQIGFANQLVQAIAFSAAPLGIYKQAEPFFKFKGCYRRIGKLLPVFVKIVVA